MLTLFFYFYKLIKFIEIVFVGQSSLNIKLKNEKPLFNRLPCIPYDDNTMFIKKLKKSDNKTLHF